MVCTIASPMKLLHLLEGDQTGMYTMCSHQICYLIPNAEVVGIQKKTKRNAKSIPNALNQKPKQVLCITQRS